MNVVDSVDHGSVFAKLHFGNRLGRESVHQQFVLGYLTNTRLNNTRKDFVVASEVFMGRAREPRVGHGLAVMEVIAAVVVAVLLVGATENRKAAIQAETGSFSIHVFIY